MQVSTDDPEVSVTSVLRVFGLDVSQRSHIKKVKREDRSLDNSPSTRKQIKKK